MNFSAFNDARVSPGCLVAYFHVKLKTIKAAVARPAPTQSI